MDANRTTAPVMVLVVEDSWYMQALIREALEAGGFPVADAQSAEEAVRVYERLRPGLVLMDLVLPDLDGMIAAARIRELDPSARVVVISGRLDERVRMQSRQLGVKGFLAKPFSGAELLTAVRAAVA